MEYGKRLNSERSLRTPKEIKGTRQKVIVTHNPSEIDQAQELLDRFPNLGSDDVIIPGTANLSFNIELTSAIDANRTLGSNIGRAIIKKLAVKFEGNEIMSMDDFDVLTCYRDLWKTKSEKRNAIRQGIISTDGCMENCIKLRINAGNKDATNAQDKATADAYRNKLIIPLDFEMLDSAAPYYQVWSVEGKPTHLYAQGMRSFEQYDEICKYFTEGKQRDNYANEIQKHLQLYNLSSGEYLVNKYALWLDFRTIDENELHGAGRHIENASEGITLQIEKKEESAGALNAYIYLIMDAQLNIQKGAYVSVVY